MRERELYLPTVRAAAAAAARLPAAPRPARELRRPAGRRHPGAPPAQPGPPPREPAGLGIAPRGRAVSGGPGRESGARGGAAGFHVPSMSSYFVNPLFSKYKGGESLEPAYYGFTASRRAWAGAMRWCTGPAARRPSSASHHVQDFFHHGTSGISNSGYQPEPVLAELPRRRLNSMATRRSPDGPFYGAQQEARRGAISRL